MVRLSNKKHQIAERLAKARSLSGLSQAQAAELIGVSYRTLQNWEYGKGSLNMAEARSVAGAYSVNIDWLIDGSEPMNGPRALEDIPLTDDQRNVVDGSRALLASPAVQQAVAAVKGAGFAPVIELPDIAGPRELQLLRTIEQLTRRVIELEAENAELKGVAINNDEGRELRVKLHQAADSKPEYGKKSKQGSEG